MIGASVAAVVGCVRKPRHVVDQDGLRVVAAVCEVAKESLRAEALGFTAGGRGRPPWDSYVGDSTP